MFLSGACAGVVVEAIGVYSECRLDVDTMCLISPIYGGTVVVPVVLDWIAPGVTADDTGYVELSVFSVDTPVDF